MRVHCTYIGYNIQCFMFAVSTITHSFHHHPLNGNKHCVCLWVCSLQFNPMILLSISEIFFYSFNINTIFNNCVPHYHFIQYPLPAACRSAPIQFTSFFTLIVPHFLFFSFSTPSMKLCHMLND